MYIIKRIKQLREDIQIVCNLLYLFKTDVNYQNMDTVSNIRSFLDDIHSEKGTIILALTPKKDILKNYSDLTLDMISNYDSVNRYCQKYIRTGDWYEEEIKKHGI